MPLVGIGTLPTPFSPASVPLPPETGGRGHTSLRVGGSNVNDIETKGQTFRYRSLLSERKQNVLIWSAHYRNESKTFLFGT
jgi:hypothetical protein